MSWQTGSKKIGYMADDEHYSPAWLFDALNVRFDLDVCSPVGGVPWIPAEHHYSVEDDSLKQSWFGLIWMNPPYSKTTPWAKKFYQHGNGIGLMPITASNWCIDLLQKTELLCIPDKRLYFEHPIKKKKPIMWQTGLFAMGEGVDIVKKSNIGRIYQ